MAARLGHRSWEYFLPQSQLLLHLLFTGGKLSIEEKTLKTSSLTKRETCLSRLIRPAARLILDEIKVVAHNFTDEVILSLYIRIHRLDTGAEITWMSSDVFEPGKMWARNVKLEPTMQCDRPEHPPEMFEFNYWFTDARGCHWHRVDRQPPEQIENLPSLEWASYRYRR